MTALEDAENIGPALAADLRGVGIGDLEGLRRLGALDAARRLEAAGRRDCAHTYLALEGALAGIRWTQMPAERRAHLAERWRAR
ncbi:TfoX/Sxy family DNA transformation protein [Microbacterium sp. 10M-3C3]|uniref:TfoX/Sxy family DNA transformation protein n=1 Tax=Microbacterium sp. 10M-3C3 TaxID=2483401 RepID=UPI000F631792|nr:TfoX/Sxy family DNA transformation protein [Microbacterium sp. 10M-3C3]